MDRRPWISDTAPLRIDLRMSLNRWHTGPGWRLRAAWNAYRADASQLARVCAATWTDETISLPSSPSTAATGRSLA